ncbi:hypothetical protein LXL04_023035 [Taraxacum kok-saghyz]
MIPKCTFSTPYEYIALTPKHHLIILCVLHIPHSPNPFFMNQQSPIRKTKEKTENRSSYQIMYLKFSAINGVPPKDSMYGSKVRYHQPTGSTPVKHVEISKHFRHGPTDSTDRVNPGQTLMKFPNMLNLVSSRSNRFNQPGQPGSNTYEIFKHVEFSFITVQPIQPTGSTRDFVLYRVLQIMIRNCTLEKGKQWRFHQFSIRGHFGHLWKVFPVFSGCKNCQIMAKPGAGAVFTSYGIA